VLIEGSKLADPRMDGIKRYVTGLMRGLHRVVPGSRVDVDVLVIDHIRPLAEVVDPSFHSDEPSSTVKRGPTKQLRHTIFGFIGLFVPSIVLPAVRFVLPEWFCRSVLGKAKRELIVPRLDVPFRRFVPLLLPPIAHPLLQFRPEVLRLWSRGVFQAPPALMDLGCYDLIHVPLPNLVHAVPPNDAELLVTVHDLSFALCPEFLDRANRVTLEVGLRSAVDRGALFVSVSEATRGQMLDHYGIDGARVTTVLNGCSESDLTRIEDPAVLAEVRRRYEIPEGPFLLTLSTIEPRKNLDGTVRAFVALAESAECPPDLHLVVAGGAGWKYDDVIAQSRAGGSRIRLIGYVADADLAALYSACLGFVYPSHYEGFGLPLIEAMRCGAPVVYGDNSAMPEVVGDAGLAVDTRDAADIARQMAKLVNEEGLRARLSAAARERAATFSWHRAARETLAVYERILTTSSEE
jgi:glycosyltransferase involved in cell wall biosynthesis